MRRHVGAKSLRGMLKVDPELVDEVIAEFAGALALSARSRLEVSIYRQDYPGDLPSVYRPPDHTFNNYEIRCYNEMPLPETSGGHDHTDI